MELGDGFFGGARAVGDRCGGLPASARASCFYYGLRKEALRDRDLAKVLRRRCPAPPARGDRGAYRSCVYGAASGPARDAGSLRRERAARARSRNRIRASRPLRETIARPNIGRNERETAERGSFTVGRVAPVSRPGRASSRTA